MRVMHEASSVCGSPATTDVGNAVNPLEELKMNANNTDSAPVFNEIGIHALQNTNPLTKVSSAGWLMPAGLVLLSLIPVAAGAFRLAELAGGADITPANARYFASPAPVMLHIVSVTIFSLLGAFQFSPAFRRCRPAWHRAAGRILIPSGLVVALSGLWMTQFYPWPDGDGVILYGLRLFFGSVMLLSILLGVAAIRRRDFAQHGQWMMRGYAIGMGAGTQALTQLPWFALFGQPAEFPRALLMGAGWVVNLAVAEWVIRKSATQKARTTSALISHLP
jgi:uncharacterized membrane protein